MYLQVMDLANVFHLLTLQYHSFIYMENRKITVNIHKQILTVDHTLKTNKYPTPDAVALITVPLGAFFKSRKYIVW